MGRTGIYACGENVSRRNSSESVVLFSLKQEALAAMGGGTFTPLEFEMLSTAKTQLSMGRATISCIDCNLLSCRIVALFAIIIIEVNL